MTFSKNDQFFSPMTPTILKNEQYIYFQKTKEFKNTWQISRPLPHSVFQEVLKVFQDFFSVTISHLTTLLQEVFKKRIQNVCKTSSRIRFAITSWRCLEDVLEDKKCYVEDVLKTSSAHLHQDECLLGKILKNYLRRDQFYESCRLITRNFERILVILGTHLFQGVIFRGCFEKQDV